MLHAADESTTYINPKRGMHSSPSHQHGQSDSDLNCKPHTPTAEALINRALLCCISEGNLTVTMGAPIPHIS